MFSSRLDWSVEANALSRAVDERRASGAPILDLTASNPTAAGLPYPAAEITAALGDERSVHYTPDPCGLVEARRAVSAYYGERGHTVDPERLVLTASTSEAYGWLFKLLADPGDELLVPHPSYPLFDFLAALESVRLRPYTLGFDSAWHLDLAAVRAAIGPRSRAILLVNPNNPTGSFIRREELSALATLAVEHDLALISDEVFSDYAFAPDAERVETLVDEERALTFCLSGLSKVVGLPQLKLGWICVAGPPAARAAALQRLELIADTYLSVGAPVQHAAARLLGLRSTVGAAIAGRTRASLAAAAAAVRGTALGLLPVEGGWTATLRMPATRTDEAWAIDLLRQDGVLTQPGYFYDFPFEDRAYLVVSLLTPPELLAEGIARIAARVG